MKAYKNKAEYIDALLMALRAEKRLADRLAKALEAEIQCATGGQVACKKTFVVLAAYRKARGK